MLLIVDGIMLGAIDFVLDCSLLCRQNENTSTGGIYQRYMVPGNIGYLEIIEVIPKPVEIFITEPGF